MNYFSKLGNVINMSTVTNKTIGKEKDFSFVEFDYYNPIDIKKAFNRQKDGRSQEIFITSRHELF